MSEKDADLYGFECPNCGHHWKVSLKELTVVSKATGKWVKCPNCQNEYKILRARADKKPIKK